MRLLHLVSCAYGAHVARGPKKPVSMTLSEDLVREARLLTRNLSDTVEQLLCSFVEQEQKRREEDEASTLTRWVFLTFPTSALGRRVMSLSDDDSRNAIINAIDAVITRAYG